MSNMIDHASCEFDFQGYPPEYDGDPDKFDIHTMDMDSIMRRNVMDLLRTFGDQGHSGFSAPYAIHMFTQLANFEALSALTNLPTEWHHVTLAIAGQPDLWQSRRQSDAFSNDGGHTYYVLSEDRRWIRKVLPWRLFRKVPTKVRYPIHTSVDRIGELKEAVSNA